MAGDGIHTKPDGTTFTHSNPRLHTIGDKVLGGELEATEPAQAQAAPRR